MHHTPDRKFNLRNAWRLFKYSRRALSLVWTTSRLLTVIFSVLTLVSGLMPAAVAYTGKLIIDSTLAALKSRDPSEVYQYIAVEALAVIVLAASTRGISVCHSLLRARLGNRVNVLILEKSLQMSLEQFEDSEFYDRLTRARREASSRPLSLVSSTFSLIQNSVSLISFGTLLWQFSPLAVLVLAAAAMPSFFAETRFSGEAFRLFQWRSPETRQQAYLEMTLAREDFAKEVQLFDLGDLFLSRYQAIFHKLYGEDRSLTLRRAGWGFSLGLLSTAALYGSYGWVALSAIKAAITLGEMTMYMVLFRQGQAAFSSILMSIGGMYEDNLYLSNLYTFLEEATPSPGGKATKGTDPGSGIAFNQVSFRYPGAESLALDNVSFKLRPGQKLALVGENGSGKTTLIKLLTRLYEPLQGSITLDGLDLKQWDTAALRRRIGVIFQDFVRYQLTVGENITSGDVDAFEDKNRRDLAARKGLADEFITDLPSQYGTQLGRWFKNGIELSGGQWQKIALSRAFMRSGADILVLDEPTSAMDAEAEYRIFERFKELTRNQMAILISHRFSTVRMADQILVIHSGKLTESGSHDELLQKNGQYARLFALQARGYQ